MTAETTARPSDLRSLRRTWAGHWHIWRGRRTCDLDDTERTGDYVATRLTPQAGTAPTVIASTPDALDAALHQQRADVLAGKKPIDVITPQRPGE